MNNRPTCSYYGDSCVRQFVCEVCAVCEATLISVNYTSTYKRYTDGREVQKPVHATIVITREAVADR